jgi:DNA-binding winged helix-turn-helix (wHTH) protein
LYQIGEYKFDVGLAHLISKNNTIEELSPLSFKLLSYLIKYPTRLVSKRELISNVWQSEVSNSSINKAISILRSHFNDDKENPAYIVTRRRLGYRIIASIKDISSEHDIKNNFHQNPISTQTDVV